MSKSHDEGGQRFLDNLNPERLVQSLFVTTDFESTSHPDMERMIEAADPAQTEQLGEKLTRAATTIDKIGQDIKESRVAWEGDAADSFQSWSSRMSSATLRLGAMSRGAGEAMKNAAQTLREVKRDMPKHSSSAKATLSTFEMLNPGGLTKLDLSPPGKSEKDQAGPSRAEAVKAQQKLDNDHGEAVRQMRKLATSYTLTASAIHQPEKATFPPMPGELMPPPPESVKSDRRLGSPAPGGVYQPAVGGSSVPPAPEAGGGFGAQGAATPDPLVGTDLAGGVVTPGASTASPSGQPPVQSGPAVPPGSVSMVPDSVLPPGPVAPPTQGPGMPPPAPPGPTVPVVVGPMPVTPLPGVSPPQAPHVGPRGRLPGALPAAPPGMRMPGDHGNGIYGGRPMPTAGPPARGIPRSPVIGVEPAPSQGQQGPGRPPMGYRPVGPVGGMGPGGVQSPGTNVGQPPLAARTGGAVGAARPPQSGTTPAGRPFTPGATGLPRSAASQGNSVSAGGPYAGRGLSASSGSARGADRRGQWAPRPDRMAEDGETWAPGSRRTVPPVVE